MPTRFRHGPLWLLGGIALAVRLHGIGWGLPELYEEAYPLKVAWTLWGFGPHAVFTWNPHFFKYPSLTIYTQFIGQALLYAGLALTGRIHSALDFRTLYAIDLTPFAGMGRLITALFGAATAPVTYALVRRLVPGARGEERPGGAPGDAFASGAAWTAALLVALNPALIAKSQEIEVDVPLAFFVTLAAWQALGLFEKATRTRCLLAGVTAGLAASTKYPGAIALVPCGLAIAWAGAVALRGLGAAARPRARRTRGERGHGRGSATSERSSGGASRRPVTLAIALVLAGAALAFVATSPYVLLDPGEFQRDLGAEREHMQFGHFGIGEGPGWGYYALAWMTRLLGWPLGIMAVVGVVLAFARRDRRAMALAAPLGLYYLLVGSWSMKADRYLLPFVPIGVALAVAALAGARERLPVLSRRAPAVVAWAAAGILFALPTLGGWRVIQDRVAPDPRTLARRWIEAHVPEGALIALEPYGPPLVGPAHLIAMDPDVAGRVRSTPRRPRLYATLDIPMFQVDPERSSGFYDLGLYPAVDLFVVTGSVRGRYLRDPRTFAAQVAFYRSLASTCSVAARFGDEAGGSDITIYRAPDHARWFATRDSVPVPAEYRGEPTGGENYFFWNLGLDYESTGRYEEAILCYRRGLRYPPIQPRHYRALASRLGHCLLATRGADAAIAYTREANATANPGEQRAYAWIRDQIASGHPAFGAEAAPRLDATGS